MKPEDSVGNYLMLKVLRHSIPVRKISDGMARASTQFSPVPVNTAGFSLHARVMRCERRLAREATLLLSPKRIMVGVGFLPSAPKGSSHNIRITVRITA